MAVVTVDFDGTLYKGNSFNVMFQLARKEFTLKEWSNVVGGLFASVIIGLAKGKEAFKKKFFFSFAQSFKGKSEKEMEAFFKKLAENGRPDINWKLVNKIHEHKANGDKVVIVSGALKPFLKEFIKEIDLDVPIISTDILYDENGICTGEIQQYINGEQKVRHVQNWMRDSLEHVEGVRVFAYADSMSDMPLFRFANEPVVVNPNKEMLLIADQHQWPVF